MNSDPFCEVCGAKRWSKLGSRTYSRDLMNSADDYLKKRFSVLFDVWFPGEDEVRIQSVCCQNCGFVIYTPRPGEKDIDAKYRHLTELAQDCGPEPSVSEIETARAENLCSYAQRAGRREKFITVLDYGGGDGRLTAPLLRAGSRCVLVDYNRQVVPGVEKLGDTIESIPEEFRADLIIASHVLEHVAEPAKVVRRLAELLTEDGCLLVEVPMEIWKRPPFHAEPVTHINFFTPNSVHNLLAAGGLQVADCRLCETPHPTGIHNPAVRALATRAPAGSEPALLPSDIDRYFRPGALDAIRYQFSTPERFKRNIRHRLTGGRS